MLHWPLTETMLGLGTHVPGGTEFVLNVVEHALVQFVCAYLKCRARSRFRLVDALHRLEKMYLSVRCRMSHERAFTAISGSQDAPRRTWAPAGRSSHQMAIPVRRPVDHKVTYLWNLPALIAALLSTRRIAKAHDVVATGCIVLPTAGALNQRTWKW